MSDAHSQARFKGNITRDVLVQYMPERSFCLEGDKGKTFEHEIMMI
jgi:hypothetical protein